MPFSYVASEPNELRQGEILGPVIDFRTSNAADTFEGADPRVDKRRHEHVLVVTADCDLLKDFSNRQPGIEPRAAHRLEHVLLCDIYTIDELTGVTPANFGSREMRRIADNLDERYHHFPDAEIGGTGNRLPEMYLDFKRSFGVPPEALYEQIARGQIQRLARLPPVFLQDLAHRLYGFLSRVGPDFS